MIMTLWHPESPGVKVKVRVRWYRRIFGEPEFATLGEVIERYNYLGRYDHD